MPLLSPQCTFLLSPLDLLPEDHPRLAHHHHHDHHPERKEIKYRNTICMSYSNKGKYKFTTDHSSHKFCKYIEIKQFDIKHTKINKKNICQKILWCQFLFYVYITPQFEELTLCTPPVKRDLFRGMEVARYNKEILVSPRKYILDLLQKTWIGGWRPTDTPMNPYAKFWEKRNIPVDTGR